jgi:hypothetical protein
MEKLYSDYYVQAGDSITTSTDPGSFTSSTTYTITDNDAFKQNPYTWIQINGQPMQIDPYTPQPQQNPWENQPGYQPGTPGFPSQPPLGGWPSPLSDLQQQQQPSLDPEELSKLTKFMKQQALVEAAPPIEPVEIATVEPRAKRLIKLPANA